MDEYTLRALLRFGLDKSSLDQAKQGTLSLKDALKQVQTQADETKKRMAGLREQAERIGSAGQSLAVLGASISGPILLAARSYAQSAKENDTAARQWLDTTQQLEASQMRIGKVAAQAALPVMRQVADLADRAAGFAEKHPGAVKAALNIGVAVAALGSIGTAVAQGIRLYADIKYIQASATNLVAGRMMATASDRMLAASGMMGAGAAKNGMGGALTAIGGKLGLLGIAIAGLTALLQTEFGQSGVTAGGQLLAISAKGWGALFGGKEGGDRAFLAVARALGVLEDEASGAEKSLSGLNGELDKAGQGFDAYVSYVRQEQEARQQYERQKAEIVQQSGEQLAESERQYEDERTRIVEDAGRQRSESEAQYSQERSRIIAEFARQMADEQRQYERSRQRAILDFARQNAEAEQSYYQERAKAAAQYSRDVQRMEEDHQRQMLKLQQSHDDNMRDAAERGDVLGALREMENYERQRQQAEEDYQVEARRRSEDFAQQMAERDQQFAEEQVRRRQEFQQRMADEEADFRNRQAQAAQQNAQQLAELDKRHKEEQTKQADQTRRALADLDTRHRQETEKIRQQAQKQLSELDQQLNAERQQRWSAFVQQLADLGIYLGREGDMMRRAREQYLSEWKQLLNASGTSAVRGSRASGGYVDQGLYQMHDNEYVLDKSSTAAMESAAGGRLNRDKILAVIANRRQAATSGPSQSYKLDVIINGDLSASQLDALDRRVRNIFDGEMSAVLRGAV